MCRNQKAVESTKDLCDTNRLIDYRPQVWWEWSKCLMRTKFISTSAIALLAFSLTFVGCGKEEPAPPAPPPAPETSAPEAAPAGDMQATEPAMETAPDTAAEKAEETKTR